MRAVHGRSGTAKDHTHSAVMRSKANDLTLTPLHMDALGLRGVTSAPPAPWVGIRYLATQAHGEETVMLEEELRSTLTSVRLRVNRDQRTAKIMSILQPSEEITDGDPTEKLHYYYLFLYCFSCVQLIHRESGAADGPRRQCGHNASMLTLNSPVDKI
ncbi:hypothetical protein EVAR_17172_1 [Eumeta japonica]|uniref:Uncharacterized protein n=1 Tax=Eumeta variegata TaxID=151549 RepID=A0A4C1U944_EUMVA|nr:hypothetical protein EVAR_17172_1 [Eumeta japonica]